MTDGGVRVRVERRMPPPQQRSSAPPTPPPREISTNRSMGKTIVGIIALMVILVLLFVPLFETEVSKYEVVETDIDDFGYTTYYTITIRDKGVGGYYYVEVFADGQREYENYHIPEGDIRDIDVHFYGLEHTQEEDFSYAIDPPTLKEKKSILQMLTGL